MASLNCHIPTGSGLVKSNRPKHRQGPLIQPQRPPKNRTFGGRCHLYYTSKTKRPMDQVWNVQLPWL